MSILTFLYTGHLVIGKKNLFFKRNQIGHETFGLTRKLLSILIRLGRPQLMQVIGYKSGHWKGRLQTQNHRSKEL